jgi:hypothetical protein
MTVARLAVSFDASLAKLVRKAAGADPISPWLADAARRKLRAEGLLDVVAEWEAEHGVLTDVQMIADGPVQAYSVKSTKRARNKP